MVVVSWLAMLTMEFTTAGRHLFSAVGEDLSGGDSWISFLGREVGLTSVDLNGENFKFVRARALASVSRNRPRQSGLIVEVTPALRRGVSLYPLDVCGP
jgi:hypothetical protein